MKSHPHTIIYDLDGTLIDSAPTVAFVLNKLRTELDLPKVSQSSFYPWISLGGKELVINALNIHDDKADFYLAQFRDIYANEEAPSSVVFPNVFDSLTFLRGRGVKLGVCSNKPRNLVNKVLRESKLDCLFDCVLAGDDLPTKKPDAKNLNWCLDSMGVQRDGALFVGDSTVDQMTSSNAKVPFAFFSKGYNDGVNENEAVLVFDDHQCIVKLFQSESIIFSPRKEML